MEEPERSARADSLQSTVSSSTSLTDGETESDHISCATTASETVMAEQDTNHVVKEVQSVGRPAPIDDTASTPSIPAANGAPPSGTATTTTSSLEAPAAAFNSDAGEQSATESQAVADASGGSDTDISRPGSVDPSRQLTGHVRTNSSVKKPSTFKSVSVTKTFLAKSAVSTPVARPGDKIAPAVQPSTSALLTAKPRLVAKSGAGNAPRTLGKVNGAGTGPDASKVWNKNQPVPPPPPKQFTDEELKQQYGIHLATRLQADEAGKEAKWADIDDDEDDWAPEAVQWMDGTKSTVAAVENQPPPVEEPKTILKATPSALPSTPTPNSAPATETTAPKTSVTGGAKTILKPGAHTQTGSTKSSLVLKGQPEKPTLVAKPSATEKKSPWATLPPVEKVSPIQINPPMQAPPAQRFSQRESHGFESMPPLPAKEIAPDDFNRSWRDDRGSRELFNSQSGRYEPVNEMRRNSVRDSGYRQQPAVLQRPVQDGPAEPSAAFQTSRSSMDAPAWGRRRNSSNVSGDQARRMSIDRRALDMPRGPMNIERRDSQSINGFDHADLVSPRQPSSVQAVSPQAIHAHPASPYGSVTSSSTHDLPTPNPAPPAEDPVEVQKRLMAEKIERARAKKQQEQDAEKKAEAERKERIAKKLAALAPPVEKSKEQTPSQTAEQPAQKDKLASGRVQTPPKPPVPTADGEVAQYGMMKVHHAQPVKKSPPTEPITGAKTTLPRSGPSPAKVQAGDQIRASPPVNQQSVQPSNAPTRDDERVKQPVEQSNIAAQPAEAAVSSGTKPQASQGSWTPATGHQPRPWSSQVWGPPQTRDRALGNGTFDAGYNRGQPRSTPQQQQQQLPVQQPTSAAIIGSTLNSQPSVAAQSNQQTPSQPMHSQAGSAPVQTVVPSRTGRVAPPLANGWGNFEAHIRQDDDSIAAKARQDRDRLGDSFRPEIRETYKDQRGQAQTTLHDKIGGKLALSDGNNIKKDDVTNAVKPVHELASPQQGLSQTAPLQQAQGSRASRFFPRPTEAPAQTSTTTSSKADSPPPPPETETHPAFTGDMSHPLVRLPKPSPVVRLPPSVAANDAHVEPAVSMPQRGQQSLGARPLAMNPEWQARFNKLLEKPGSTSTPVAPIRPAPVVPSTTSSRPGALAPAALSKSSLDDRVIAGLATVSLPSAPLAKLSADNHSNDMITRSGAEALFEDREFGSLPTVKLSKVPHLAAGKPAVGYPQDDPHLRKRYENPFTIRRLEAFDIEKLVTKIDVVIRISTMRTAVIKSMPRRRRGPKNTVTSKPKQTSTPNGVSTTNQKDRPRKPSQQSQGDLPNGSPRPSTTGAWSTNNRPGPHQQSTWARRAAASVH